MFAIKREIAICRQLQKKEKKEENGDDFEKAKKTTRRKLADYEPADSAAKRGEHRSQGLRLNIEFGFLIYAPLDLMNVPLSFSRALDLGCLRIFLLFLFCSRVVQRRVPITAISGLEGSDTVDSNRIFRLVGLKPE